MRNVTLATLAVLGMAAPAHAGNVDLALDMDNLALQYHTSSSSSASIVLPEDNELFPLQLPCDFVSMNGHFVIEHNAGTDRVYPKGRFSLRDEWGNTISSEGANPVPSNPFSVVLLPLYTLLAPGNTMMAGWTIVDDTSDFAFQPTDFPPGVKVEIEMDVVGYVDFNHTTPHTEIDMSDNVASLWVMRPCDCRR